MTKEEKALVNQKMIKYEYAILKQSQQILALEDEILQMRKLLKYQIFGRISNLYHDLFQKRKGLYFKGIDDCKRRGTL